MSAHGQHGYIEGHTSLNHLGRVEEVDALVPSGLETVLDDGTFLSATVCEPASEGEDGNLETGTAQVAEDLKRVR